MFNLGQLFLLCCVGFSLGFAASVAHAQPVTQGDFVPVESSCVR